MGRVVLYVGDYNEEEIEWAKKQAKEEDKSFTEFVTEVLGEEKERRERGQKD